MMRLLDLTCGRAEEDVALDEALLEAAEQSGQPGEVLRLWEPVAPLVVIGRSSQWKAEVHVEVCRRHGIPILRRSSGGAAIVAAPGCLMYGVVLSYELHPELRMIDVAHQFVLSRLAKAISRLVEGVKCQGTSDLAVGGRKFSGNSMRAKRGHLLYHGTLLYDMPLELVGQCLALPPRQPDYRQGRGHQDFVINLPATAAQLRQALIEAWQAHEPLSDWPRQLTHELLESRYLRREWNEAR
jgi:lipoate-protein ligase A